ncbi:MAG TPA: hypothetical protein VGL65_07795 [Gemmatimonadales bacterium]
MRFHSIWLLLIPGMLAAQSPMAMDHDQTMTMDRPLTQKAKDEIAEARRVASLLNTPEKARLAGYRPRFGDVPLQGIHWSNPALVLSGQFDVEHPPTLMFAPINGEQQLVGVAYTYEVKDGAPMPDGFDGAAMWHEHPALSLPGHRLVMTHVWFIDSPYGPFAHDNPELAFLERAMSYPPDGWLDAGTSRRLALGLSLANPQAPGTRRMNSGPRNDSLVRVLIGERDTVDVEAERLEAARVAGKKGEYQSLAAKIGRDGDSMLTTIKEMPADPVSRAIFSRLLDEALAGHAAPGP